MEGQKNGSDAEIIGEATSGGVAKKGGIPGHWGEASSSHGENPQKKKVSS